MATVEQRHLQAAREAVLAMPSGLRRGIEAPDHVAKSFAQAIAYAEERERKRIADKLKAGNLRPDHDSCDYGHCEACYLEGVVLPLLEGDDG